MESVRRKIRIMDNSNAKEQFLNENIFHELQNLNDGFDSHKIKYFSANNFRIILERIEKLGIGIYGIEPWKNGEFYDVSVYEDYTDNPLDPLWYNQAFNEFISTGEELQYSATYCIPSLNS